MVSSRATTVEQYLAELPDDRRADVARVREVILANLPDGFEETMQYGMIGYAIPLERFPNTYNGQALGSVALAAQKRHISVYLHALYASQELTDWFVAAYAAAGKKLDMGQVLRALPARGRRGAGRDRRGRGAGDARPTDRGA